MGVKQGTEKPARRLSPGPDPAAALFSPTLSLCRGGGGGHLLGGGRLALAEAVLEAAGQRLEVAHAARARRLPPLGLLAPVDCGVRWVGVEGGKGE